ncbi:YihY/virulence factor BrkB family protein [Robbsia sp. Bb-Pol-6]|uniref:YihY/virulence factor BrkB family protein n=1 Tax=Robbsia betulipollinis TaxID=2981849 RepID=A0ABT3ZM61_9BURK|nr:YihY/virulence factor BrkB family protein [Robbsia betulipollinis]MCY0387628.1 YihY/virulence factor BrkB family protein [Robbsia betulipollinis]
MPERLVETPLRGTIHADGEPTRQAGATPKGWLGHLKKWGMWFYEPVRDWIADRCSSLSASIAFYSAFSLAPTLVLIIAIISFFYGADAAQGKLVAQIRGVVGEQAAAGIQTLISSAWNARTGTGTTVISIIVVAIGASATFSSLNTALNEICPPDSTAEGARASILSMVRIRLISFGLVIGAGFLVVVLLVLDAVINVAGAWLLGAENPSFILANLAQRFVSFLILLGAFSALLKLLPDAPIPWRAAFIGGTTSALLFTGGKNLFSFYLAHAGTANSFGAAGSLAVVLMWLYYSAAVFLLGAEVTAASARRSGDMAPHPRTARKPKRLRQPVRTSAPGS